MLRKATTGDVSSLLGHIFIFIFTNSKYQLQLLATLDHLKLATLDHFELCIKYDLLYLL